MTKLKPPAQIRASSALALVRDLVTTLDEFVEEHSDPGTRALGVLSEARRFISTGGTGHVEDSSEVDAIAETINAVVGMAVPFPKLMAAARGVEKLIEARRAGAVPDTGQASGLRVIHPRERDDMAAALHSAECDCGDRPHHERETGADYSQLATAAIKHARIASGGTVQAPDVARRLAIAQVVAEYWRDVAMQWGDDQIPGCAAAHPLACVLAAIAGETDELGIGPGPDADRIRALLGTDTPEAGQ